MYRKWILTSRDIFRLSKAQLPWRKTSAGAGNVALIWKCWILRENYSAKAASTCTGFLMIQPTKWRTVSALLMGSSLFFAARQLGYYKEKSWRFISFFLSFFFIKLGKSEENFSLPPLLPKNSRTRGHKVREIWENIMQCLYEDLMLIQFLQ